MIPKSKQLFCLSPFHTDLFLSSSSSQRDWSPNQNNYFVHLLFPILFCSPRFHLKRLVEWFWILIVEDKNPLVLSWIKVMYLYIPKMWLWFEYIYPDNLYNDFGIVIYIYSCYNLISDMRACHVNELVFHN